MRKAGHPMTARLSLPVWLLCGLDEFISEGLAQLEVLSLNLRVCLEDGVDDLGSFRGHESGRVVHALLAVECLDVGVLSYAGVVVRRQLIGDRRGCVVTDVLEGFAVSR